MFMQSVEEPPSTENSACYTGFPRSKQSVKFESCFKISKKSGNFILNLENLKMTTKSQGSLLLIRVLIHITLVSLMPGDWEQLVKNLGMTQLCKYLHNNCL